MDHRNSDVAGRPRRENRGLDETVSNAGLGGAST
jgi:hypothetical protein